MWRSTLARLALPVLQRSLGVRLVRRPGPTSVVPSLHVRGQQTLPVQPLPRPPAVAVRKARALEAERLVEVQWGDGGRSLYPFTWLRDNCQCPACTLQSAQARKLLLMDVDVDTGVHSVDVTNDNKVSVVWPDQHRSVFRPDWLKKRCFSAEARRALQEEMFVNERYLWDSALSVPTIGFQDVLVDDEAALRWLLDLRRVGLVLLKGAPAQRGQVARLADRIGYVRMTYYGATFQVQDKPMANNVAYTTGRLSPHTDYPALLYTPGLQFLHCINQAAEGGASELVDGFHAAEQLRQHHADAFATLSSLSVNFVDVGADYCDFLLHCKKRTIDLDSEGRVVRVNLNNATRDTVLDLPLHQVQPFYSALKTLTNIVDHPQNVLAFTMEPGDVVTFDNTRLLHGRRSYVSDPAALRHLEGAYLDWDEALSRLRILRNAVRARE